MKMSPGPRKFYVLYIERYLQPREKSFKLYAVGLHHKEGERSQSLGGKPQFLGGEAQTLEENSQPLGETPLRLGQKLQALIRLSLSAGL